MKTIKIKFDTDNELTCKGLENLNQYTFQDGVIDIYVKSSLVVSNSVVGITFNSILKDGSEQCETRNATYVKDKAQWYNESSDYTLYEMKLPKIMTLYSGKQSFNVCIMTSNEDSTKLVAMATSGNYKYNVNASASTDYEVIDTAEVERLDSLINDLTSKKQDKTDTSINVSDGQGGTYHTVVGSLNTLSNRVDTNVSDITTRKKEINALDTRVSDLESKAVETFHFVGSYESENEPNESELNDFVKSKHETLHNGDSVLWVQTTSIYLCVYANEWTWSEITGLGKASNERYGVVKGSSTLNASGIAVELNNGDFKDIRVKIGNGDYSLDTWLNKLTTEIEDIEKGNVVVGESVKATKDGLDNVISDTYMTKTDGATKTDLYDYALPNMFNDARFIDFENNIIVENSIAKGNKSVALTSTTNQITLLNAKYANNKFQYELSKNNSITFRFNYAFESALTNISAPSFTLNVYASYNNTEVQVATKTTTIDSVSTDIKECVMQTQLNLLSEPISRNIIALRYELIFTWGIGYADTLNLLSTTTYNSYTTLNTTLNTIAFTSGKVGEINKIYVSGLNGYTDSDLSVIASVDKDIVYNLIIEMDEPSSEYPYSIKVSYLGVENSRNVVMSSSASAFKRLNNTEIYALAKENTGALNLLARYDGSQFILVDNSIIAKRYADTIVASEKERIDNALSTETTRATETEKTLEAKITSETTTRANADTQIQSNLSKEIQERKEQDTTLQSNIDRVEKELSEEIENHTSEIDTWQEQRMETLNGYVSTNSIQSQMYENMLANIDLAITEEDTNVFAYNYYINSGMLQYLIDNSKISFGDSVTSSIGMFVGSTIKVIPSGLPLNNITNVGGMFALCYDLLSVGQPLTNTTITQYDGLCFYCYNLREINWDLSGATDLSWAFEMCEKLKATPSGDLSDCLLMEDTFKGCKSLETFNFTNIGCSFDLSDCVKLSHDTLVSIISTLQTTTNSPTLTLGTTLKSLLSDSEIKVATDKGWTIE